MTLPSKAPNPQERAVPLRPIVSVAAVALIVACIAGMCGCPKRVRQVSEAVRTAQDAQDDDFTIRSEDGKEVKIDTESSGEDSGKATITTSEGETVTTEYGKSSVSEKDMGIDFYPGATVETGGSYSTSGEHAGHLSQVALVTKDPFDKVAAFYKRKYGQGNTVMDSPGECMIVTDEGTNKGKMIIITEDKEEGVNRVLITVGAQQ